ncbi:flotillin family protein [Enterocloster aldenensis]|uniref:flotillin family protein n=1 Tax=Enterocloster aldenensis TaxID=358742 RepID=UPI000E4BB325|nr:flotillin family protein [Enterocloster aldenensis]
MLDLILPMLPIVLVVIILLGILASGYVKAPPDRAYIISGLKKEPKILTGRAGIKIPFLERLDKLYLGQMTVDIKTEQSVPTNDFINVNVDAVAKVRIEPSEEGIKLAAKNFLNKNQDQITLDLQDSLQGNMREIIGTLTLKAINTDRDSFSDQVMEKASKDMKKLGIEIVSCNIQNVTDENGLIKDLGADNTARIKKDASIAKAQAERDIAIAQAEADKTANDARVISETEIAQRNNELSIKKSELQKVSDTKKAEADAAYEIQRQEQEKTIQTATVNAQIAKAEKEAELKTKEVAVMQQKLEAEINKKADAERYRVEQIAAADLARRQREAEAKKYEQEKEAEAKKAIAEAQKYAMLQEAEGVKAKGEAEATAIQAKGLAEAEAMEKKAEAMKKYGQAAMMEMIVQALPEMAKAIAEPLSTIDKVTIIDSGNGEAGVSSMGSYVPGVLAKTIESVKETTGLDITEIMKANTYDAKVTRNVNISGLPENVESDEVSNAMVAKEVVEATNSKED